MTTAPSPLDERSGLSSMNDEQRYRLFDEIQASLPQVWAAIRTDQEGESVVVVPSISLERTTASSAALTQAMEERSLFLLLLLRQPRLRMIYVTSLPISEAIVSYYLGLLPGVIASHARDRLTLVSLGDGSPGPLSAKLLARPRMLRDLRALIRDPGRCHLIPYNTTSLERDVALSLGIPMYGADPRLSDLGTKTGCRRLFEELGVRAPIGVEDLHSVQDLVAAVQDMRRRRPEITEAIVKLNDGVSGSGNALVDLRDLPPAGDDRETAAVRARILGMALEDPRIGIEPYLTTFHSGGGIVEERITGTALTSPSVQLRVLPGGEVELLSTHDQLLGGASGQRYLGCIFPADPAYAAAIAEPALVIARRLAALGVLGRFAVDFLTVRDEAGAWTTYAIELNLRKGGTTHPFLTLQFLTDGTYDQERAAFVTPSGRTKHLVATDHCEDDRLRALRTEDLFDIVARHRLHFDSSRQVGTILHMISCLTECGRIGYTSIGDTAEQAWELYRRTEEVLLQEADLASQEGPLLR